MTTSPTAQAVPLTDDELANLAVTLNGCPKNNPMVRLLATIAADRAKLEEAREKLVAAEKERKEFETAALGMSADVTDLGQKLEAAEKRVAEITADRDMWLDLVGKNGESHAALVARIERLG